jgi:predicted Zn-dependent protease
MEGGQPSNAPINGIPAASAGFRVTTSDGVVQGRVSFLNHGGTLLRFLGFAAASAWESRGGAIRSSLESFRALTDRSKLEVEPARLRLVTVPRAMDLETFLEREGVSDRAGAVRNLNRLSGNASLAAGRVLKVPKGGTLPGGAL